MKYHRSVSQSNLPHPKNLFCLLFTDASFLKLMSQQLWENLKEAVHFPARQRTFNLQLIEKLTMAGTERPKEKGIETGSEVFSKKEINFLKDKKIGNSIIELTYSTMISFLLVLLAWNFDLN